MFNGSSSSSSSSSASARRRSQSPSRGLSANQLKEIFVSHPPLRQGGGFLYFDPELGDYRPSQVSPDIKYGYPMEVIDHILEEASRNVGPSSVPAPARASSPYVAQASAMGVSPSAAKPLDMAQFIDTLTKTALAMRDKKASGSPPLDVNARRLARLAELDRKEAEERGAPSDAVRSASPQASIPFVPHNIDALKAKWAAETTPGVKKALFKEILQKNAENKARSASSRPAAPPSSPVSVKATAQNQSQWDEVDRYTREHFPEYFPGSNKESILRSVQHLYKNADADFHNVAQEVALELEPEGREDWDKVERLTQERVKKQRAIEGPDVNVQGHPISLDEWSRFSGINPDELKGLRAEHKLKVEQPGAAIPEPVVPEPGAAPVADDEDDIDEIGIALHPMEYQQQHQYQPFHDQQDNHELSALMQQIYQQQNEPNIQYVRAKPKRDIFADILGHFRPNAYSFDYDEDEAGG